MTEHPRARLRNLPLLRAALCLLATCLVAVGSHPAAMVRSWSASTGDAFALGTLEGTAVDEEGRVQLAPDVATLWGPAEGIVWDVQPARRGAAFVALSGPARVLLVKAGDDPQSWYEAGDDVLVTALEADGRGGVYLGIAPTGEVLHATKTGHARSLFGTGAKFVWALSKTADGTLWIATGVPGRVMRHSPDGDVEVVYESEVDPVRCLAPLPDGGVVAGTGGRGLVIRIDRSGRPYVLYDADEKEIVAVATTESGAVLALTSGGAKQVRGSNGAAAQAERTPDNTVRVVATPPPGPPSTGEQTDADKPERPRQTFSAPAGGALYRIDADGGVRRIWQTSNQMPFDLVVLPTGRLLVSTGDAGRVHLLDETGRSSRLLRIASNQASALALGDDGRVFVGGTSDARVESLGPEQRDSGRYFSQAIDAGSPADWGQLSWDALVPGRAGLSFSVRAGNTAEPDETWTDWLPVVAPEAGTGRAAGLPPARWLQLRAELTRNGGASPALRAVELAYLPRNRAPHLDQLTVRAPGVVWSPGPAQPANRTGPVVADDPVARQAARSLARKGRSAKPIRKSYEQGARTFTWAAKDPDGDRLQFALEIRREAPEALERGEALEGSGEWLPLAHEIEADFFSWDARSLPDGSYRVRLTANDARDNPEGKQLQDRKVSKSFVVDNTRPRIEGPQVNRERGALLVEFSATDSGTIAACEVAVDGGSWGPLDPLDGLADSAEEHYRLRLEGEGRRSLMVRVTDSVGNLGGQLWIVNGN